MKYWYEKESDIPAEHKALYEERELELKRGEKRKVWVCKVEGAVPRETLIEFRETNVALTNENKELKDKYTGIEDPDRARDLLKIAKDVEVADAEKVLKKGGVDAIVTERTRAIKEDMEGKLKIANEKAANASTALDNEIIQNTFLQACAKLQLQPGAETMILQTVRGQWVRKDGKVVILDSNGNPRSNKDGSGDLGPTEWLQETLLKQHPYLVKESSGSGAAGGGAASGGVANNVNPWKRDTFNLTQQAMITKADPAKAARLKEAAKQVAA